MFLLFINSENDSSGEETEGAQKGYRDTSPDDRTSPEPDDDHEEVNYKNAASTRMLLADEIQRGLAEVEEEEDEVEERGLSVERDN